ncbi:non-hydrolyzing UDP-N-acetylglucosamine 2-epimerase [Methanoculleus sp.]|jgi:UDP-N-acetylglucosamine 2-epimerase (non-hydrolysing)|uniref:non-hydrolyzing UDP-N-acetylglucosamine 2-epimerase n=1 Tax=Methanoculleus sp. TaxID=90427 RepID=UPI0025F9DBA4|nr:UDP-N-acetylglucosamine 2-epimerase (non-hydrolyzing) [Methanoculleus sp.]
MKISVILGTRPEIIKMSPIIRYLKDISLDFFILHTGQHYSYEMERIFFQELELPDADYNLEVGSGTHGQQTGKMLNGIEDVLLQEKPDVVLVQGDTNTVLAGALAAAKLGIKVGHVEAGLRSFDRSMPEEINRVVADHLSDYLFAPTVTAQQNLLQEGISSDNIFVCGNTVVDALFQNIGISESKLSVLDDLGLQKEGYFLVTAHRQENVDNEGRLNDIVNGLLDLHRQYDIPIIFSAHPRTINRLAEFDITLPEGIRIIEPPGYLEFLQLEKNAKLVLTDSGGVQEETCILRVPCVTLRNNTERPETIEVGSNILVGTNPSKILNGVSMMLKQSRNWVNPFGDGKAAEKIVSALGA